MNFIPCNVVYVDRSVVRDRTVSSRDDALQSDDWESPCIKENVGLLLARFDEVFMCATGSTCIAHLIDLQQECLADLKPVILLLDVPHNERLPKDTLRLGSSASNAASSDNDASKEEYGLRLLQMIVSESHFRSLSKLVVPIPIISCFASNPANVDGPPFLTDPKSNQLPKRGTPDRALVKACLDLGAADIMVSPLHRPCLSALEVLAYRAHKDAAREQHELLELKRGRKRSWVGVSQGKPFAYLRESMVANLMKGICQLDDEPEDRSDTVNITIAADRKLKVAAAIGHWHFCAHDFSDDELVVGALLMLKHALASPALEKYRIPADQLTTYLVACRAAYNSFVPYHNFRHVVDVLQATFNFLTQIGALPPYPAESSATSTKERSPIAMLLNPFEALTLLITAIGHDAGHPGVNNGFLVVLNAPLAQLYNDRSVLESFHCAAYSQILRRHWPAAFQDTKMRNLMISSILATDMGLHFDYMKKLGDLEEKLQANNTTDGWNGRMVEEQKALACSLLIKCADISNVARKHDTALKWMHILQDEFSRQASMETELQIASSLMAPPNTDEVSLWKAQLGFMNLFAIPLFQGVAGVLPGMQSFVDELEINKAMFEQRISEAQPDQDKAQHGQCDGALSPRSKSVAKPPAERENYFEDSRTPSNQPSRENSDHSRDFSPQQASPTSKPAHLPARVNEDYKEVNGVDSPFDAVADFAASDPFNSKEARQSTTTMQRHSEATDTSASVPGTGDWASQATSATTGKMPISPSTQGTSIVSRDSLERPLSVPVTTITAPDSSRSQYSSAEIHLHHHTKSDEGDEARTSQEHHHHQAASVLEDELSSTTSSTNGKGHSTTSAGGSPMLATAGSGELKPLKKKSSRFRLNFFRRHNKSSSPPLPAADAI